MTTTSGLIIKSNVLIEAGYRLSLTEQRIVAYAMTAALNTEKGLFGEHLTINAQEFAATFSLDEGSVYGQLKEAMTALFKRYLTITDIDPQSGKERVSQIHWLSRQSYIDGAGAVQIVFGQDMLQHITRLESNFTSYRLSNIVGLTSVHSFRLYELLAQYLTLGQREIELEWLKGVMEIEDSYGRIDRFKACVIDPAIQQINERTDIRVDYTQRKLGRIVTHLVFTIKPKPIPKVKKSVTPTQMPASVTQVVVKNSDSEKVKNARAEALAAVLPYSRGLINPTQPK